MENYTDLIESNLGLAFSVARKFINSGIEYDDLIGICNVGLVKAASSYDFSKKVQFSTFAYRVMTNEVLQSLRGLRKTLPTFSHDVEFEQSDSGKSSFHDLEFMRDDTVRFDNYENNEFFRYLFQFLSEREVLCLNYSIFSEFTQREISSMLHMTQATVSRTIKCALLKLHKVCIEEGISVCD